MPDPTDADHVTMVEAVDADTTGSPDIETSNGKKSNGKSLGILFWCSVVWIGLITFGAVFADVLPIQSPSKPDNCSTLATIMDNEGIDANAAKLFNQGVYDTPREAQHAADAGEKAFALDVDSCPTPTLDAKSNAMPSARHWLGTDKAGRDVFARVVHGAQVALLVGVVAIAIGMMIGGAIGLVAGYFRGVTEGILMTIVDIALAYPALVLAIAIVAFRGQSLFNVCVAISVVAIPAFARIARGATLSYSEREFVTAARVMGAKHSRIIFREVLPNVVLPVMAFALLAVAIAIVAEGGLAFLGLSVQQSRASWGGMIKEGYDGINEHPYGALLPSFVMFVTVLAFNLIGDKFRKLFDVKESVL